ncbi:MAG: GTPase Era [Candidatus Omnitrophota bacterium]|nr:GTPase Era [Candidatus Omnitrophota bacterium]
MKKEAKKDLLGEGKCKALRCGFVAVVGRPNVGKSTLVNNILGEKIAIVSTVPQTTRNKIRGIYNDERGQIIFIDTPGMHLAQDALGKYMNNASQQVIQEADLVVHLVDTREQTGREEKIIVERLRDLKKPIILGLNKIDLKGKYLPQYLQLWEAELGKPIQELADSLIAIPLSGLTGANLDKLLNEIFTRLPKGELLYPRDIICDIPQKLAIEDIIREKFLNLMREEVPFSIAVLVEEIIPRSNKLTYIRARILVERDSQKEIVIGKKGHILKQVGSLARKELEELLNSKVFLETFVTAEKNWRKDNRILRELGYTA